MSIAEPLAALKKELLEKFVPQLLQRLQTALHQGQPVHAVEQSLWDLALQLGQQSLAAWLAAHGTGDIGPTATLPDGRTAQRLPQRHPRRYRSIFGTFKLQRTVYGSREGQALAFVPLDNRLQLPADALMNFRARFAVSRKGNLVANVAGPHTDRVPVAGGQLGLLHP